MADEPDVETYEAAERLVREAQARAEEAARAGESGEVPPRGWATPGVDGAGAGPFPDLAPLLALLSQSARGSLPPELARQLADALRELLVALRAIIDFAIARLERPEPEERRVEDIPIQ
jgi:hypothetical protein